MNEYMSQEQIDGLRALSTISNRRWMHQMEPTTQTADELARIAYAAYGKTTDFKNYQGLPMPEYDELTDKIKQAWQASVTAVCEAVTGYGPKS